VTTILTRLNPLSALDNLAGSSHGALIHGTGPSGTPGLTQNFSHQATDLRDRWSMLKEDGRANSLERKRVTAKETVNHFTIPWTAFMFAHLEVTGLIPNRQTVILRTRAYMRNVK
jgi:hypothetical protein